MRRLISCFFCPAGEPRAWERFARVLETTARRHNPAWSIEVAEIPMEPRAGGLDGYYRANTLKLDYWVAQVLAATNGDELALLDADMMVLGPLDDVWRQPFDLAITMRDLREPSVRAIVHGFPLNAGVVFLRISSRVRDFIAAWGQENRRMLEDRPHHHRWQRRYGGINQSALGFLRENGGLAGLEVAELPCAIWNCEDASWKSFDPERTRIVHVKGGLRRAVLGIGRGSVTCRPLAALWQSLEMEAAP